MKEGDAGKEKESFLLGKGSDEFDKRLQDDFDVLEIEEREKVVRHMWDIYIHNPRLKLTSFWQEAFQAAYEELESEVPGARESAISEIAKMSLRLVDMDPLAQKMDGKKKHKRKQKHQITVADKNG
ncbi:hypothetical protein SUGI_0592910 [Cryptomeria japonica]|nr:hypothetical protein SUGI_0592910 [Cryptomeria japonica]